MTQFFNVFAIVSVTAVSSLSFAAQEYKCFGKNPYGDKITATFVVDGNNASFNDQATTLDASYKSQRGDKVRFRFNDGADCNDLCSEGVLVSKEVLTGATKVFMTQEWKGEGYQSDNYACFAK